MAKSSELMRGFASQLIRHMEQAGIVWWIYDGYSIRRMHQTELVMELEEVNDGSGRANHVEEPQPEAGADGGGSTDVEAGHDGGDCVDGTAEPYVYATCRPRSTSASAQTRLATQTAVRAALRARAPRRRRRRAR